MFHRIFAKINSSLSCIRLRNYISDTIHTTANPINDITYGFSQHDMLNTIYAIHFINSLEIFSITPFVSSI